MENNDTTKSIKSILNEGFFIPDYQRGYRWIDIEVKNLLEDLLVFFDSEPDEDKYYCLQPLVVSKRDDGTFEVIDGQQRLTTLYLIIKVLFNKIKLDVFRTIIPDFKPQLFSISYKTRENSARFLENIDVNNLSNSCIDYFYISRAYKTIKTFFDNREKNRKENIGITFIKNFYKTDMIRFIWYDVTQECRADSQYAQRLFSRLNIGKIPLTNAELIKSLFLNSIYSQLTTIIGLSTKSYSGDVIESYYSAIDTQIQNKIATDWDLIEKKLNEPSFWAFIYGKPDIRYATRIELIFDVLADKSNEDERFFTFNFYDKKLKEAQNNLCEVIDANPDNIPVLKEWEKILELFHTFCSWYDNRELYHYIGFLRYKGVSLRDFYALYNDVEINSHEKFISLIKEKALEAIYSCSFEIENLEYPKNQEEIRSILLLFNIKSILETRSEEKFSFNDFYSQQYDLEHIKPQTPNDYDTNSKKLDFVETCLEYLTGLRVLSREELRQKQYEENLEEYAIKIQSAESERILYLLELRRGSLFLDDNMIDNMLQKLAPSIHLTKLRNIKTKQCREIFRKQVDDFLKNAEAHSNFELIGKLNRLYSELIEGTYNPAQSIVNEFNREEKELLGIEEESGPDNIGNLVLLDSSTNRRYKNASFIVKRHFIHEQEKQGVYIPRCTKNVFNKIYSKSVSDPMRWTESDMNEYLEEIKRVMRI